LRRAFLILLAAGLLAGGVAEARDLSPLEFMQRFLADPGAVFRGNQPLQRRVKPKPAETPLLAVPLPHLRPLTADVAPVLGYQPNDGGDIVAVPTEDMPTPHLRPTDLLPALTAPAERPVAITPPEKPATVASLEPAPAPAPLPKLIRPPPAAASTCGIAIAKLGVIATPLAAIEEGDCGVAEPVAVSALDSGRIDLSGKAIVDCHLAEQLANWVKDTVVPKVRADYSDELTGLRIVDSYTCRTRDNIEGAKLSEHAHGNAIDIAAFRVGKRWIEVGPGWTGGGEDATFLADVRKSACGPFTTVLGPGSDSYHSDHFHLDMMERRTAGPSKGRYCK